MILVCMFLFFIIVFGASMTIGAIFRPNLNWLRHLWIVSIVAMAILAMAIGGFAGGAQVDADTLKEQYTELNQYYSVIEASSNEYARFYFYQQVQEYNAIYDEFVSNLDNPWIGLFYQNELDENLTRIEFNLHDGTEDNVYG